MPSPFPGMDPWLEAPHLWPGLHGKLLSGAVEQLQPQLNPRGYYIDIGERVWLTTPGRSVYPDHVVFTAARRTPRPESRAAAVFDPDEPVRIRHSQVRVTEGYLEIFAAGNRLVTGIEFVSPANKSNRQGRKLYQAKQAQLRRAGVHLVEIDLIRRGRHVLDVPKSVVETLRPWDYLVNLVRRGSDEHQVDPIPLRNPLPRIRIPLEADQADAVLDLQPLLNHAWDIGPYQIRVDYDQPPSTPLSEADVLWADGLLRTAGLRQ